MMMFSKRDRYLVGLTKVGIADAELHEAFKQLKAEGDPEMAEVVEALGKAEQAAYEALQKFQAKL